MTVRDLLTKTMSLIGAISAGENMSASEAADGLASLNDLLDSWSTDGLLIFSSVREVFNLVPSQSAYTIGSGGNFNTSRPMVFESAGIIQAGTSPEVELPIKVYNIQEWSEITSKTLTSSLPLGIFLENNSPLATINFYPVPSVANKLVLYSTKPITNFSSINDSIVLPTGYTRALRYNLAMELTLEYGKQPSEFIMMQAQELKSQLMRVNADPVYLKSDAAFMGRNGAYNWLTGE